MRFSALAVTFCALFTLYNTAAISQSLSVSLTPNQYPNGYNVSAYGADDGSINATVNNAIGPVTFLWNDSVTTEDRPTLAAGTYTVMVTDSLDSTATATITLTQPALIQPLVVMYQKSGFPGGYNVSSFGTANGSITLTVTGGLSPYHFLWNDGIVQKDRTGLSSGMYSVLVTDSLGDSATASINMIQPGQPLTVQLNASGVNPCGGGMMPMLNAMVSGGTPPYQYQWSFDYAQDDSLPANVLAEMEISPKQTPIFRVKLTPVFRSKLTPGFRSKLTPPVFS